MRVRMTLVEKGLEWTSHHLDLVKREHITDDYFGINPNGVVPTLVDDGVVIIESDDIIDYLDKKCPTPPLRPQNEQELDAMYWWMDTAITIHLKALKVYIYMKKMRGKMKMTDAQEKEYARLQKNPDLIAFHEKSSSKEGFSDSELAEAEGTLDSIFSKANTHLEHHDYLVGDNFSLADITWIPVFYTLAGTDYHFDQYPHVLAWASRLRERESFKKGILEWCPNF